MAELALLIYLVYLGLAFGLRSLLQWRATGSTGFVGISGRLGSAEWLAGALFAVALLLGLAAPVLALTGTVEPLDALDGQALNLVGLVLAVIGVGLTLYAQVAMGSSWRIGVDPDEQTELVTAGPFALVRNPIFSAMMPTALGLAMMVPSVVSIGAVVALLGALQLQVRVVEEPYLLRVHGNAYRNYAREVGRFFPGLGRIED
jgi:protein-S-isoprenylcysteine O-methyltransferase Ste14